MRLAHQPPPTKPPRTRQNSTHGYTAILPVTTTSRSRRQLQHRIRVACDCRRVPDAGGAGADRGVRRCAGAGPGAGDRHLPVYLDTGLRRVALDARQADAARDRGGRRRRSHQRAVLLVLPAVLRRRIPDPARSRPVRPARGRVRRLDAGRLRYRRPGRHAHPPGRPRDHHRPGRLRRARPRGRAVAAPALPDTGAHQHPQPAPAWIISQWHTKGGKFAFTGVQKSGTNATRLQHFCLPRPRRKRSGSASPSTGTRSGRATSRSPGSGRSSGPRAAGCSRCQCCSSPRPSGWSAAGRPEPPGNHGTGGQRPGRSRSQRHQNHIQRGHAQQAL